MHPLFAPAELTPADSEDLDQRETPETKGTTSTFLLMWTLTERGSGHKRRQLQRLGFAFFVFGLFNNGELLSQIQTLEIF